MTVLCCFAMSASDLRVEIEGMSCDGCVRGVQKALGKVGGVRVLKVDVGSASVALDGATQADVQQAIEKAGFTVRAVHPA